ncbi:MAG: FimV/HubP family polar landmark protein, partial [Ramlibacter sp.]
DPPALRQGQQPLTAQASPIAPAASPESRAVAPQARGTQRSAAPATPAAPSARAAASAPATAAAPAAPKGEGKQVTAQAGDTAGKIAAANKPPTVSLDQMLVALLRSNPDAFSGGNINRLRAGAVLTLPSQEQAEAVTAGEAHQTLVVQSRDFNEFRRRLAEGLPATPTAGAERESRGRVQAQVDEKKPATATPDKLTLSKGAVQGKSGEDRIARDRAAQDAATRVAELNRNLSDLKGLTGSASAPKAGASAPAAGTGARAAGSAPTPALPLGAPTNAASAARAASAPVATAAVVPAAKPSSALAATAASAPVTAAASAPVTAAASAPAAAASTAAPAATGASAPVRAPVAAAAPTAAASAAKKPARPVTPPPEPSLVDQVMEEPLIPAAIGGALLVLLGVFGWRVRQRRQATQVDSSFLESRLQPDSFFGASGGQRVDTDEGAPTGSSMVYSPSQLDAAGDVDPVAEADVYLAYGRDLQAEEILKEALRINPQRVAIHTKLLEIYAKRRDAKAFEQVASEAYSLTHGEGSDWARICELGQDLEPGNPMYKPGGHPTAGGAAPAAAVGAAAAAAASNAFLSTGKHSAVEEEDPPSTSAVDLDLDLDFSLGDEPPPAAPAIAPAKAPAARTEAPSLDMPLEMDFGTAATPAPAAEPVLDAPDLSFSHDSLDFGTPAPAPVASTPAPAAADPGMIEFDLGALSLDLGNAPAPAPAPAAPVVEAPLASADHLDGADDPLATKLALAEEFNAIGDADGARSLAQEVIAEASGDLKHRAQRFLAEIG